MNLYIFSLLFLLFDYFIHQVDGHVSLVSNFFTWRRNLRIHYVSCKSTCNSRQCNNEPVLLLPGFGVGIFHFKKNLKQLSERGNLHVYSLDLLGQGNSWPDSEVLQDDRLSYSAETWTDQIIYFISTKIKRPVRLVGNSLGGYLSVCVASKRPDLVKGIVLLNATPFWGFVNPNTDSYHENKAWRGILPVPNKFRYIGSFVFNIFKNKRFISSVLHKAYVKSKSIDADLIENILTSTNHPMSCDAFTSMMFSPKIINSFENMLQNLKSIPICLIYGKNDPWIVPFWGKRIKRLIPDATYYELSPVGHCPHDEAPRTANELLLSWLRNYNNIHPEKQQTSFIEDNGQHIKVELRNVTSKSFSDKIYECMS